ncbi:WD40 repeat-like protein [Ascodesmis nigricans]|uniref:WD40 repeat-like protein n=1 Tax=Ascodesmis nigricans TaxID=341454 RepID=A0A4S2N7W1_9PEZI|nr:WD40 repeat-like protein [Ascodesmis nigricans]
MAAPVTRLQPAKLPTLPASTTPEQRYWQSFTSPLLIHEYGSVTSINFCATTPHDFAITSSTLVKVFSSKTRTVAKTISRFKDTAYSAQIRRDGKVLAAADASGLLQIFDLQSRAVLRTWGGEHEMPVQAVRWNPRDLTALATGGDDATVRLWELPVGKSVATLKGHEDYVRSLAYIPGSTFGGIVSGGYDKMAKLWDPRAPGQAALSFSQHAAVEDVLPMPGGTTLLVAAGNTVTVWDIIAAREIAVLANHQKTVTALTQTSGSDGSKRRVLTGALDGHVKIYDAASWTVVHGVKYPKPVLSLGVSPDEKHLAVGMVDGLLSIRTRLSGKQKDAVKEKERAMDLIMKGIDPRSVDANGKKKRSGNKERRLKGMDYKGENEDIVIDIPKRAKRERAFEKKLRKGAFADALDLVLGPKGQGDPMMVLAVVKELVYRGAVTAALANRDEETLEPVLRWCLRCVGDPRMVPVVAEVLEKVLDLYSHALGQSPEFDKLVGKLAARIRMEVGNARMASRAVGMIGLLVAGNNSGVRERAAIEV